MMPNYRSISYLKRDEVLKKFDTVPHCSTFFYNYRGVIYGGSCDVSSVYKFHYKDRHGKEHTSTIRDVILSVVRLDTVARLREKQKNTPRISIGAKIISIVPSLLRWNNKEGVITNVAYCDGQLVKVTADLQGIGAATLYPKEFKLI